MYGDAAFGARQFRTVIDGRVVEGVADGVTQMGGRAVAVEAKFAENWRTSIRNPESAIGQAAFAQAEQLRMLEQARTYSQAFDEVIYHSNSTRLIQHYSGVFAENGLTNVRFIYTP